MAKPASRAETHHDIQSYAACLEKSSWIPFSSGPISFQLGAMPTLVVGMRRFERPACPRQAWAWHPLGIVYLQKLIGPAIFFDRGT
jgi:hypothetical protein